MMKGRPSLVSGLLLLVGFLLLPNRAAGAGDPNEPNDRFGKATSIQCPSFVAVDTAIDPAADVDFYQLTGTPGFVVEIDIDAVEVGSTLDSTLGVFDSSTKSIAISDDDPAPGETLTVDSFLRVVMPGDGVLFIAVSSFDDLDFDGVDALTTGTYDLSVTCTAPPPPDSNESNDNFANATQIGCLSLGDVDASVHALGDVDFYLLNGVPGSPVDIDIDADEIGSTLDSTLGAFDSAFNLIAVNDDDPAPREPYTFDSFLQVFMPDDGLLYIAVSAFNDMNFNGKDSFSIGTYTLSVDCLQPDPNEPNDDFSVATPIECPSAENFITAIGPRGDVDFFELTGAPGSTVTIDIDASELGSRLDSNLGVFDSGFGLLAVSENDPAPGEPLTVDSFLSAVIGDDGLLFIAVSSFDDLVFDGADASTTGTYSLSVNCLPPPAVDANEPNDEFATATPLHCQSFEGADGTIHLLGDVDVYLLSGKPGSAVVVDIDAAENKSTLNSTVGAFDSAFNLIAANDDDPAFGEPFTQDSFLVLTMPADGLLYLALSSFADLAFDGVNGSTVGAYSLDVSCLSPGPDPNESNDAFGTATPIECPSFSSADTTIDPLGDVDFYLLTGTPGAAAIIDVDAAELGSTLDSTLGAFDSAFNPMTPSDDDPAPNEPLTIDSFLGVVIPDDGQLYIAVSSYSDLDFDGADVVTTGPYALTVSCHFPAVCGDGLIVPPETCDPPGQPAGEPDECRGDCTSCSDGIINGDFTELMINGDFEIPAFLGWTLHDAGGGSFVISTPGTSVPTSDSPTSPNPVGGAFYAVTDQFAPGARALSQTFTVPSGATKVELFFEMFVDDWSETGGIIDPIGLDASGPPNQHARVDLLSAGALPFDTGASLLATYYIGVDPSAPPNPYTAYGFDITAEISPGGTFELRFAEVDNQGFLHLGIDNVSVVATLDVTEDCDDGNNLAGDGCNADCVIEDADFDGVADPQDNCPLTPNADQGTALFNGTILAFAKDFFAWPDPQDVKWARGDLGLVGVYEVNEQNTAAAATLLASPQVPSPGDGFYWVVRPDCPLPSWSSGGPAECQPPGACPPGGRDGNLP